MGRKIHPFGFRLGGLETWRSRWFSDRKYRDYIFEDFRIRRFLEKRLSSAGLVDIIIERSIAQLKIIVKVARPGLVIGRGGSGTQNLRQELSSLVGAKVDLEVQEVKEPELQAKIVAEGIAQQIKRRMPVRRVIVRAAERVMEKGAKGVKITCSGVLGGPSSISRRQALARGSVPLTTLRSRIDYAAVVAQTTYGSIGIKVWINRGKKEEI